MPEHATPFIPTFICVIGSLGVYSEIGVFTRESTLACPRKAKSKADMRARRKASRQGIRTLTREQVRRIDRLAIETLGIPGIVLMENAGRSVAEEVLRMFRAFALETRKSNTRRLACAVLCGGGNNGGDGYVIARHLYNAGARVHVYSTSGPERIGADTCLHRDIVEKMRIPIRELVTEAQLKTAVIQWRRMHVIIDALLGTGFSGDVRAPLISVIHTCNALKPVVKVVAVDVPSGLDCDTGKASNATVRADATVTFVASKPGFLSPAAKPYVGRLIVAGIGTPPELLKKVT